MATYDQDHFQIANQEHWTKYHTYCDIERKPIASTITTGTKVKSRTAFQVELANAQTQKEQNKIINDYAQQHGLYANIDILSDEEQAAIRAIKARFES